MGTGEIIDRRLMLMDLEFAPRKTVKVTLYDRLCRLLSPKRYSARVEREWDEIERKMMVEAERKE
jgi:hypothetical protein